MAENILLLGTFALALCGVRHGDERSKNGVPAASWRLFALAMHASRPIWPLKIRHPATLWSLSKTACGELGGLLSHAGEIAHEHMRSASAWQA